MDIAQHLSGIFHPHNVTLVALSLVLAVFASYASLELAGRIGASDGSARWRWLGISAIAMGGGIWSMHFVAMLGLALPFPVTYDVPLTILSLAVAICFAGFGLYAAFWGKQSLPQLSVAGVVMGSGIAAMHYAGMAALQVPVTTSYDPALVSLSVLIAMVASGVALWLAVNVRTRAKMLGSAVIMGAAIAGMHFTGMAAFVCGPSLGVSETISGLASNELAALVIGGSVTILAATLGLAYYDQMVRAAQSSYAAFWATAIFFVLFTFYSLATSYYLDHVVTIRSELETLQATNIVVSSLVAATVLYLLIQRGVAQAAAARKNLRDVIFQAVTDGLIVTDVKTGKIADVNDAGCAMYALSRERMIGSDIGALSSGIAPYTPVDGLRLIEKASSSGEALRFEWLSRAGDGILFWTEIAMRCALLEGKQAAIAVVRDIRERKQAELELKRERDRAQRYLDIVGVMVLALNPDGTVALINRHGAKLLGYETSDQIVGRQWIECFVPEQYRAAAEIVFRGLAEGKIDVGDAYESYVLSATGGERLIAWHSTQMRDDQGRLVGSLSSGQDITEARLRDERMREIQKMESVGQLTGGIAHEFNNLLTVIKANAEDLAHELKDSDTLGMQASMTLEAADRGAGLVRQLMAFSRKQELEPQPTDVNTLVDIVARLAKRTFPANIAVDVRQADTLPLVNVDPGQLETAILNIALNARDAMESGGTLTFETMAAHLDADYAKENAGVRPGDYVLICISDTGEGMDATVAQRAFDPFFTTKEVGKGTGLGLSMVYGFVRQSGGLVKLYSEVKVGTTVKIYLPPAFAERAAAVPTPSVQTVAAAPSNILLVEDDPLVRKSVVGKLRRLGYEVTAVGSAAEALTALENGAFALLFSDVIMPGAMTGADLVREAARRWPQTRALLTSGYTEAAILGKVKIPEGVKLLSKPYSNEALAQAISDLAA